MLMSKRHYAIAITIGVVILVLLMVVALAGCGGGDNSPAASAKAASPTAQAAGEGAVKLAAGPLLGDMDSDGNPTATDAQLIMNIVVDPDSYELGDKYIADCNLNGVVETGDALKVLRAAAGEIEWPFSGGGPPPPPPI